jgi:hypothetical protein
VSGPVEDQTPTPDAFEPSPRPRWVKIAILIGLAIVVLAIVAALAGGHGPSRHTGGVDPTTPAQLGTHSAT